MKSAEFAQLQVFVVVAERCNFREAATAMGMAPSTVSQMVRALEDRLDLQLFNRTTRSVRLTSAGRLLLGRVKPLLSDLERAVHDAEDLGSGTRGQLRLVASRAAARLVLPELTAGFHAVYPRIELDITIDDAITNIVESDYDAGVRVGHLLEQDMVALPLGGEQSLRVVASPEYLARAGQLTSVRDLRHHNCIRMRHGESGGVFPWRFRKAGKSYEFAPKGNLIVDDETLALHATLAGEGIACLLAADVAPFLTTGELVSLLDGTALPMPPFHLYYLRSRHQPQAMRKLVDFIRDRLA